jgi:hypothetical protein
MKQVKNITREIIVEANQQKMVCFALLKEILLDQTTIEIIKQN